MFKRCFLKSFDILFFILIFSSLASSQEILNLVTEDYPPLNYLENGLIKGPSVDLVKEIEKKLNRSYEINVYQWARGYQLLNNENNIVLFSTGRTTQREDLFRWVGPIAEKTYVFYARKGSGIILNNLNDAKQYTIGVQTSGVNNQFITANEFLKVDRVSSPIQNFQKLTKGRIDLWFTSRSTFVKICEQEHILIDEFEELFSAYTTQFYYAFSKSTSDQVINSWQETLDELYADGTVKKIFSEYNLEHMIPELE